METTDLEQAQAFYEQGLEHLKAKNLKVLILQHERLYYFLICCPILANWYYHLL